MVCCTLAVLNRSFVRGQFCSEKAGTLFLSDFTKFQPALLSYILVPLLFHVALETVIEIGTCRCSLCYSVCLGEEGLGVLSLLLLLI